MSVTALIIWLDYLGLIASTLIILPWRDHLQPVCAAKQVTAQQLLVRPLELLGCSLEGLGEVGVDTLARLQTPAERLTTYLDSDVRVSRLVAALLFLYGHISDKCHPVSMRCPL